ncbi:uncharacterized protein BDR25DRAFT_122148 [Lindgomyces ingoldianus]|uniref:Uncharacterized protein n=1 Tax=Lindgomyces ingoldianus TaxID=673940 RepID=A0ACB6R5J8_9PLEO|nr:uncharacterized protein BDR25DRAFT_122148 [Lindgomyces ingoldianus]KAF2474451.1 hypothetical protein BDR25DRAFT_122148 [Lindgomyces ingoldianus]
MELMGCRDIPDTAGLERERMIEAEQELIQAIQKYRAISSDSIELQSNQKVILSEVVTSYARASCAQICATIFTNLPRELRDQVYEELIRSEDRFFMFYGNPILNFRRYHYCNPDFVGKAFVAELAETYYTADQICFDSDSLDDLQQLLTQDTLFKTELIPGDLIRRVKVLIYLEEVEGAEGSVEGLHSNITEFLEDLATIRNRKCQIQLEILTTTLGGQPSDTEVVAVFAPGLATLCATGFHVSLNGNGKILFPLKGTLVEEQLKPFLDDDKVRQTS